MLNRRNTFTIILCHTVFILSGVYLVLSSGDQLLWGRLTYEGFSPKPQIAHSSEGEKKKNPKTFAQITVTQRFPKHVFSEMLCQKRFPRLSSKLGKCHLPPHLLEAAPKHSTSPEKFYGKETAQSCLTCSFPSMRRMVASRTLTVVSLKQPHTFPSSQGRGAHALFYPRHPGRWSQNLDRERRENNRACLLSRREEATIPWLRNPGSLNCGPGTTGLQPKPP